MGRVLILCSGGPRSALTLALTLRERYQDTKRKPGTRDVALFIDHSQTNVHRERRASVMLSDLHDTELFFSYLPLGPKTTAYGKVAMLLEAIAIAEQLRPPITSVVSGIQAWTNQPDEFGTTCRKFLLHAVMGARLEESTFVPEVDISLPLTHLDLKRVLRLGVDWMIPWDQTWSCQHDGAHQCGICTECQQRRTAFIQADVRDSTIYSTYHWVDTPIPSNLPQPLSVQLQQGVKP